MAKKKKKKKLTKGQKIVKKAKKYVGKKYKAHNNFFTKHFAGKFGIKKNGYYPMGWCTIFVLCIFDFCGYLARLPVKALGKKASNVKHLYKALKKRGKIVKDPKKAKKGNVAFKKVGSTKKKSPGHASIFIKYKNGWVYTVDGNVGGGVKIRKKKASWYVAFSDVL